MATMASESGTGEAHRAEAAQAKQSRGGERERTDAAHGAGQQRTTVKRTHSDSEQANRERWTHAGWKMPCAAGPRTTIREYHCGTTVFS